MLDYAIMQCDNKMCYEWYRFIKSGNISEEKLNRICRRRKVEKNGKGYCEHRSKDYEGW